MIHAHKVPITACVSRETKRAAVQQAKAMKLSLSAFIDVAIRSHLIAMAQIPKGDK